MRDKKPRQSALRERRVSIQNWAYTITKCVHERDRVSLTEPDIARTVIDAFIWCSSHKRIRLGGFVIMPDHYHAIFALRQHHTLSSTMATINRFTARHISSSLSQLQVAPTSGKRQFWERGYYDHAHRSRRDFRLQLDYIHNNPVRKQLIGSAEEWPFSTASPEWSALIDWEWFR